MENVCVGDDECSITEIVSVLMSNPCTSILVSKWKALARGLGTPEYVTENLRLELLWDTKETCDVLAEILISWRSREADNAKLKNLLNIMEIECGWKYMAEQIRKKFLNRNWNDLSTTLKNKIMDTIVEFMGVQSNLKTVLANIKETEKENLLNRTVTGELIFQILSGTILPLTQETIPVRHSYYIPRTLSLRNQINPDIFRQPISDIFVVDGIDCVDLSKLAGKERMETSSQQRNEIRVRYILLEFPEDFESICKIVRNKAVHHLRYENKKLYWVKSHGKIHTIQQYVTEGQDTILEVDLLRRLQNSNVNLGCVCIADNPGMGKTELLVSLRRHRCDNCSEILKIFIVFREFLQFSNCKIEELNRDYFIHRLASHISLNAFGREIFVKLLNDDNIRVDLFIDGFDELDVSVISDATKLLQFIIDEFKNLNLYVTTRLHKRHILEQALGTLSFNINPFTESDQINFLNGVWYHEYHIQDNFNLGEFSRSLISNIRTKLPNKESEVVGVPLQCALLAEIYRDDARKYANSNTNLKVDVFVDMNSIADVYRRLMATRFERAAAEERSCLIRFHVIAAIDTLFPSISETLKKVLHLEKICVKCDEVDKIGFIQIHTTAGTDMSNACRFLHRTYAEFLLAEYLVSKMADPDEYFLSEASGFWGTFIFDIFKLIECETFTLLDNLEIQVYILYKYIILSLDADDCRKNWTNLAAHLGMREQAIAEIQGRFNYILERNIPQEYKDPLWQMLSYWNEKNNGVLQQAKIVQLIDSLSSMNYLDATEKMKSRYYESGFLNYTFLVFVDSCLITERRNGRYTDLKDESSLPLPTLALLPLLFNILKTCTLHDFCGIFQLVSKVCLEINKEQFPNFSLDWSTLFLKACEYSSIQLIDCCRNIVEGIEVKSIKYLEFPNIGQSPLHVAIRRGDFSVFEYMHKLFEGRISDMKYLLHSCLQHSLSNSEAIITYKLQMMSLLLNENKICINERDTFNRTPLLVRFAHVKLIIYLISQGADITIVDSEYGETVAHNVAESSSPEQFHEFTEFLLENGYGDIFSIQTKQSRSTPLQLALEAKEVQTKTLKILSAKANINFNIPDWEQDTALLNAVAGNRSLELIKLIIELGGDSKQLRKDNQTIIHAAAVNGHLEALNYFLSNGHSVNARDTNKRTPLHAALIMGKNVDEVVGVLVRNNADIYSKDATGRTPIWYAENGCNSKLLGEQTIALLRTSPSGLRKELLKYAKQHLYIFLILQALAILLIALIFAK